MLRNHGESINHVSLCTLLLECDSAQLVSGTTGSSNPGYKKGTPLFLSTKKRPCYCILCYIVFSFVNWLGLSIKDEQISG